MKNIIKQISPGSTNHDNNIFIIVFVIFAGKALKFEKAGSLQVCFQVPIHVHPCNL